MLKSIGIASALVSCTMMVGCASIVDGTHQMVYLTTIPVKGAHCILTNSKGKYYVKSTPDHVKVHRAYGALSIICQKHHYQAAHKTVESKTKGMAFGNAVFGGVIGAGVDMGDGAAYDYPNTIMVQMHKVGDKKGVKIPLHTVNKTTVMPSKKADLKTAKPVAKPAKVTKPAKAKPTVKASS